MSELTDNLMKQMRMVTDAGNAFLSQKKQRLTGQQRVLAVLRLEDGLKQSYLMEILSLSPSSLAELLKKLEKSGDITREEDAEDKRIKNVFLTEAGRQKAEKLANTKEENFSEVFFGGLTEEEMEKLSELLDKITTGWPEELQARAQDFIDPMDRLKAMQDFRQSFEERFGGDWGDLSGAEMKEMRKEMERMGREMHRGGFRGMPGGFPGGMGRGGHRGPGRGFWDAFNQKEFGKENQGQNPNKDEWQDF